MTLELVKTSENDALEKFLPFLENIFKKVNSTDEKYEAKLSMHDLLYKMKVLAILDPATIEKFQSGQDTTIRFKLHWDTLQVEGNIFLNKESKFHASEEYVLEPVGTWVCSTYLVVPCAVRLSRKIRLDQ